MICAVEYGFGVCFFLAALMKPIHPEGVGLWYRNDPANFSLHVGGFSGPAGQERELLGWWLVPVGCSLGGGTILLTTYFALWSSPIAVAFTVTGSLWAPLQLRFRSSTESRFLSFLQYPSLNLYCLRLADKT
jgi:hypothetical protein